MESCKYCKKQFEPWIDAEPCWSCDNGIEEDIIFDGQGPTEYRVCTTCKGEGEIHALETKFCSAHCRCDDWDERQDF